MLFHTQSHKVKRRNDGEQEAEDILCMAVPCVGGVLLFVVMQIIWKPMLLKKGLKNWRKIALQKRTAYMCSEAVWWRCHRSMVWDYLKVKDWKMMHIIGEQKPLLNRSKYHKVNLTYVFSKLCYYSFHKMFCNFL